MHMLNESQIVAFVAIGFDFLVGISDDAVTGAKGNYKSGAFGCIAAGAIFQAVVFLYWIVAFGSTPTSLVGNALAGAGGGDGAALSFALPSVSLPKVSFSQRQQTQPQQPPVYGTSPPAAPANSFNSPYAVPAGLAGTPPPPVPQANAEPTVVVVGQARALYAYAANAADPNEISFAKGQILEVLDNKGKWWHARYQDPVTNKLLNSHCSNSQQPTSETWLRQKLQWIDLILAYCAHHRLFLVDLNDLTKSPLFSNSAINRSLNRAAIDAIFADIVANGNGEWEDKKLKSRCFMWWKKQEEWAALIYNWASENGLKICTVYEIIEGDTTEGLEFHGLHIDAVKRVLEVLVRQGKGQIFYGSSDTDMGIKFA
ncbi:Vacuolar protein-sorting-associated protein 25 [Physocladia obscura]|uniref:Vacuolar protein-sorting-associated protein 25 n=1 Tax=Physocladia obscura TaxID=109957 RepID=A0AAD5XBT6_9FUNG|nr:Vacuolar protein-sorting-associated protein 25 [Physocladia obscura]